MSDLMRNQFEEWQLQTYCGGSERLRKCKNDESYYYYTDVQLKWKAWQASRECLVIELPHDVTHVTNIAYEEGRDDVLKAVHAAGVKTK